MTNKRHRSFRHTAVHRTLSNGVLRRQSFMRFIFMFTIGIGVGFGLGIFFRLTFDIGIFGLSIGTRNKHGERAAESPITSLFPLHHNVDFNSSFAQKLLNGLQESYTRKLAQEVRILCWVMTQPRNHKKRAFHVKATWGRHCNFLIFMSEKEDEELPAVKLDVPSGRKSLWAKTVASFKYVYENFHDDYDWVLKADDDTYVIVENLRSMLLPYKSSEPHYFGFQFKPHTPMGYVSGGAGYVLSYEAVDLVVNEAFDGENIGCPFSSDKHAEDVNLAKCLYSLGVHIDDSRDANGRNRFLPFDIEHHMDKKIKFKSWFKRYSYWPIVQGPDCCSDKPISFHYVKPNKMYILEFLVYHVNVFPVLHLATAPPIVDPTTNSHTSVSTHNTSETTLTMNSIPTTVNFSITFTPDAPVTLGINVSQKLEAKNTETKFNDSDILLFKRILDKLKN